MRDRVVESLEVTIGAVWWGGAHLIGALMSAMFVLAPLLLANLIVELFDTVSATVAIVAGVAGAYVVGLPPWDGEERINLLLIIGGTAVTVVAWDLLRGSATAGTLLLALAIALLGWPIRAAVSRAQLRRSTRGVTEKGSQLG